MMYGSESWAVDRKIDQRMGVAEMRSLWWISGVTRIEDKMRENRLS